MALLFELEVYRQQQGVSRHTDRLGLIVTLSNGFRDVAEIHYKAFRIVLESCMVWHSHSHRAKITDGLAIKL